QIIGPAVVLAAQGRRVAGADLDHAHALVAADVVESGRLALAVDERDERPAREVGAEVVAGLLQDRGAAEELPRGGEELLPLLLKRLALAIPLSRKLYGALPRCLMKAAMPAWHTAVSCSALPPEAATAPTTWPSTRIGTPPTKVVKRPSCWVKMPKASPP